MDVPLGGHEVILMYSVPEIKIVSISFDEGPDSEARLAEIVDLILGVDEKIKKVS